MTGPDAGGREQGAGADEISGAGEIHQASPSCPAASGGHGVSSGDSGFGHTLTGGDWCYRKAGPRARNCLNGCCGPWCRSRTGQSCYGLEFIGCPPGRAGCRAASEPVPGAWCPSLWRPSPRSALARCDPGASRAARSVPAGAAEPVGSRAPARPASIQRRTRAAIGRSVAAAWDFSCWSSSGGSSTASCPPLRLRGMAELGIPRRQGTTSCRLLCRLMCVPDSPFIERGILVHTPGQAAQLARPCRQ